MLLLGNNSWELGWRWPNLPFTSSAAMERPVLASKPTTLEHTVWRKMLTPVLLHPPFLHCSTARTSTCWRMLSQSIPCVWFGSQGVRTCQHRIILRILGSQSSAAQVRVSLSSEREMLHKSSQKAAIYYVETTLWTSGSWTVSQALWEQHSALVWGRVPLRLLAAHDEAGLLLPVQF